MRNQSPGVGTPLNYNVPSQPTCVMEVVVPTRRSINIWKSFCKAIFSFPGRWKNKTKKFSRLLLFWFLSPRNSESCCLLPWLMWEEVNTWDSDDAKMFQSVLVARETFHLSPWLSRGKHTVGNLKLYLGRHPRLSLEIAPRIRLLLEQQLLPVPVHLGRNHLLPLWLLPRPDLSARILSRARTMPEVLPVCSFTPLRGAAGRDQRSSIKHTHRLVSANPDAANLCICNLCKGTFLAISLGAYVLISARTESRCYWTSPSFKTGETKRRPLS